FLLRQAARPSNPPPCSLFFAPVMLRTPSAILPVASNPAQISNTVHEPPERSLPRLRSHRLGVGPGARWIEVPPGADRSGGPSGHAPSDAPVGALMQWWI